MVTDATLENGLQQDKGTTPLPPPAPPQRRMTSHSTLRSFSSNSHPVPLLPTSRSGSIHKDNWARVRQIVFRQPSSDRQSQSSRRQQSLVLSDDGTLYSGDNAEDMEGDRASHSGAGIHQKVKTIVEEDEPKPLAKSATMPLSKKQMQATADGGGKLMRSKGATMTPGLLLLQENGFRPYPKLETGPGAGTGSGSGSGSRAGGLRNVLGFRSVVVQRTQLHRMEKEIERALDKHRATTTLNNNISSATTSSFHSSRSSSRYHKFGTHALSRVKSTTAGVTGVESFSRINSLRQHAPAQLDTNSRDLIFLDEIAEILDRWRPLTVEIPFHKDIFKQFSSMLRADRHDQMTGPERTRLLDVFEQMRRQYPFHTKEAYLDDIIWCIGLLSPLFICDKARVHNIILTALGPMSKAPVLPLTNINAFIYVVVRELGQHRRFPEHSQDPNIEKLCFNLLDRLHCGDLAIGRDPKGDMHELQYRAKVTFLQGLLDCMRHRRTGIINLVLKELLPKYWIEVNPLYPQALNGVAIHFSRAACEIIVRPQEFIGNESESAKSLQTLLFVFMEKYFPPSWLCNMLSVEAIQELIRVNIAIFSQTHTEIGGGRRAPRVSIGATGPNIPGFDVERKVPLENMGDSYRSINNNVDTLDIPPAHPPTRVGLPTELSLEASQFFDTDAFDEINDDSRNMDEEAAHHEVEVQADEADCPLLASAQRYFDGLWTCGFQEALKQQINQEISGGIIRRVVNIYRHLIQGPNPQFNNEIVDATIATFFNKLAQLQPRSNPHLSVLLHKLLTNHKASFFKPMMACVASDSAVRVGSYINILSCLQQHLSPVDLFMRDSNMWCVILMTDVGPNRPRNTGSNPQEVAWGTTTLGQCAVVVEFIHAIKQLSKSTDNYQTEVGKMFLIDLERTLGLHLVSKEKHFLVPPPVRVLISIIFFEIRMMCNTIHRPVWIGRLLEWIVENQDGTANSQASGSATRKTQQASTDEPIAIKQQSDFTKEMFFRLQEVYGENVVRAPQFPLLRTGTIKTTDRPSYAPFVPMNVDTMPTSDLTTDLDRSKDSQVSSAWLTERLMRLAEVNQDEPAAVMSALIAVQATIQTNEYVRMTPSLWDRYLMDNRPKVAAPAAFLFMKCTELAPKVVHTMVARDMNSLDPRERVRVVQRLMALFGYRHELLSQRVVHDPSTRGPFRGGAPTVPFALTEIGSARYTMDEPRWLTKLKTAANIPEDARKRIVALGWGEKNATEMELFKQQHTPLTLLWSAYLDTEAEVSQGKSQVQAIQPKKKRQAVVSPVINSLNLEIISLLADPRIDVRLFVKDFMTDLMRNEPLHLLKAFFSAIVTCKPVRQKQLFTALHQLVATSAMLPPGFTYGLFNHILGLLKWIQRNNVPNGIDMIEASLPLLSDILPSTSDIVFKDLRRKKVDMFIGNLGGFWNRSGLSPEEMFPTRLMDELGSNGRPLEQDHQFLFLDVPRKLLQMALMNVNQIYFLNNFQVRYPQEVYDIRQSLHRFARMPRPTDCLTDQGSQSEQNQFVPNANSGAMCYTQPETNRDRDLSLLSSLRSRSWLKFTLNLVTRLNPNYCDRLGLMNVFNGISVILLEHWDDVAILTQALEVYIVAATSLKRFFTTQNGYGLFLPSLFKIFCDSEKMPDIRHAIHVCFRRFFLLHQEIFVVQSLGAMVPLLLRTTAGVGSGKSRVTKTFAKGLYQFLETLANPVAHREGIFDIPIMSDPLAHSSYKMHTTTDLQIPSWLASLLPKSTPVFQTHDTIRKDQFPMADTIKLFVAVIAFDPGSHRSEQFLRAFQILLPFFKQSEEELVTRSIGTLVRVFEKFSKSSKPLLPASFVPPAWAPRPQTDTASGNGGDESRFSLSTSAIPEVQAIRGKNWAQNDRVAIKHEMLMLVEIFVGLGGSLTDAEHRLMVILIKSILKDYQSLKVPCTTDWIKKYIVNVLLKIPFNNSRRTLYYMVSQFAVLFRSSYKSVDFSGYLVGLAKVVSDSSKSFMADSPELVHAIRLSYMTPALTMGPAADWGVSGNNTQVSFCNSLVGLVLALLPFPELQVLAEILRLEPSPHHMAYVIVPLCLQYNSHRHNKSSLSEQEQEYDEEGNVLAMQFWLSMLSFSIKACEYSPAIRKVSRAVEILKPVLNAAIPLIKPQAVSSSGGANASGPLTSLPIDMTGPMSPRLESASNMIPMTPYLPPQTPRLPPQTPRFPPQTPRLPPTTPHSAVHPNFGQGANQEPMSSNLPGSAGQATMNASPGLILSFIALRIIIVRGERYLNMNSGCWLNIFKFVKQYFLNHGLYMHGNMLFAQANSNVPGSNNGSSGGMGVQSPIGGINSHFPPQSAVPMTPLHASPQPQARNMVFSPGSIGSEFHSSPGSTPNPWNGNYAIRDRVEFLDGNQPATSLGFIMWSFMETVVYAKSPLAIIMRPFIQEQLRLAGSNMFSSGGGGGLNSSSGSGGGMGGQMSAYPRDGNSSPRSTAFHWPLPRSPPSLSTGSQYHQRLSAHHFPHTRFSQSGLGIQHSRSPSSQQSLFELGRSAIPKDQLLHPSSSGSNNSSALQVTLQQPQSQSSGMDPESRKRQDRLDRRKMWKSWSKSSVVVARPTTVSPLMSMDVTGSMLSPDAARPMAPSPLLSIPGTPVINSNNPQPDRAPETSKFNLRRASVDLMKPLGGRHQLEQDDPTIAVAAGAVQQSVMPALLVERSNLSLKHVRALMTRVPYYEDSFEMRGSTMYPNSFRMKPSASTSPKVGGALSNTGVGGGAISMGAFGPGVLPQDLGLGQMQSAQSQQTRQSSQFLFPGQYDRQPSSPGFGSMFLAREAALRAASDTPPLLSLGRPMSPNAAASTNTQLNQNEESSNGGSSDPTGLSAGTLSTGNQRGLGLEGRRGSFQTGAANTNLPVLTLDTRHLSPPVTSRDGGQSSDETSNNNLSFAVPSLPSSPSVRIQDFPFSTVKASVSNPSVAMTDEIKPGTVVRAGTTRSEPTSAVRLGTFGSGSRLNAGSENSNSDVVGPSTAPAIGFMAETSTTLNNSGSKLGMLNALKQKRKSILKPRIITTSPPQQSISQFEAEQQDQQRQQQHRRQQLDESVPPLVGLQASPTLLPIPATEAHSRHGTSFLTPAMAGEMSGSSGGSTGGSNGDDLSPSPIAGAGVGARFATPKSAGLNTPSGGGLASPAIGGPVKEFHPNHLLNQAVQNHRDNTKHSNNPHTGNLHDRLGQDATYDLISDSQSTLKAILKSIEEETRMVLAAFPKVFKIGHGAPHGRSREQEKKYTGTGAANDGELTATDVPASAAT